MILSRLHPIEEALRSRPREVDWVLFDSSRSDRRINDLKSLCRESRVPMRYGDSKSLERTGGRHHQGAVARLAGRSYWPESEALTGDAGARFLLVLDQVQDPQNLGSILRVADAVAASVVVPERGAAPLSEAVARSSAGAIERVRVIRAGNLRRFLDLLKNQGFRILGIDPQGDEIFRVDLTGDIALVLGSEGKGLRRLVREGCDELARLPMAGGLASLNVSTAAAAAAYEAVRQRRFIS